jgi:hypothetical protein
MNAMSLAHTVNLVFLPENYTRDSRFFGDKTLLAQDITKKRAPSTLGYRKGCMDGHAAPA